MKCWTCGYTGTLWTVGLELVRRDHRKYSEANRYIRMVEDGWGDGRCGEHREFDAVHDPAARDVTGEIEEYPNNLLIPEADYKVFSGRVPMYALDRGLTLATCREWELGHDPWRKRLLFPVRDYKGRLVGVSGRKYYDGCPRCFRRPKSRKMRVCVACGYPLFEKYLHTDGFRKEMVLYGEHKIVPGDTCIIVEGPLDVLRVWQYGFDNVLGVFGSEASVKQMRKLVRRFRRVVAYVDADGAGKRMGEKLVQGIFEHVDDCPVVGGYSDDGEDPGSRGYEETCEILAKAKVSPGKRRDFPA